MASFHATAVHPFANFIRLQDREDGGRRLAEKLKEYKDRREDVVVLGLPRGGVVTAYFIATELGVPLDVAVARKIGCPSREELAVGALSSDGTYQLNTHLMHRLGIQEADLAGTIERERKEAQRRLAVYRGDRPELDLCKKVVILVDDGIATGATSRVAALALRKQHPHQLVLAVPVMPFDRMSQFHGLVDELVVLAAPKHFSAVGQFYVNFDQTEDEEVLAKLRDAQERWAQGEAHPSERKCWENKTTKNVRDESRAAGMQEAFSK